MEVSEYHRIAEVEDQHWWYRNTRGLMQDLLAPFLAPATETPRTQRILDAGCGPGGNGAWLAQHGEVVGVDLAPEGLAYVRARRPEVCPVQASITALPFPDDSFDVTVEITVVTCVSDDLAAIRELARVTKPGGVLLLFEPAHGAPVPARRARGTGRARRAAGPARDLRLLLPGAARRGPGSRRPCPPPNRRRGGL
jgi:SAM-dependent methyltransferase